MNRTLRRPMFRMGGTAEGITSGLDAPDINKRQNLNVGGGADARRFISRAKNMPSLSENKTDDSMESRYNRAMDFIRSKQTPRRSDLNDFLINLGLNLVSQPSTGNIFSDVGQSAKGPYARFSERKSTARQEQDKLS